VLHLVARQRPAAYVLPTTRFIPDRRTLVSRVATRPRDLLLLALRVLLVLSAAAAFARPVVTPRRAARARIVLLDRSGSVADAASALAGARRLLVDGVPTRVIAFDSVATQLGEGVAPLDSLARTEGARAPAGSVSGALVAARRTASRLARRADSVELVLVSPVTRAELDAATDSVRAQWPGALRLDRVPSTADSAHAGTLERALGADDPLLPAMSTVRVSASPSAVRLRRGAPDRSDSVFARAGGTVVQWDTAASSVFAAGAIAMGDDVIVASLARRALASAGRAVARWSDGAPAAIESSLGAGCIRQIGVGVPLAGDLPLSPAFQRIARGLLAPCGLNAPSGVADSTTVARLVGRGGAARGQDLARLDLETSSLTPWLLAIALVCALLELAVRARQTPERV
jgi:hypothetical protein